MLNKRAQLFYIMVYNNPDLNTLLNIILGDYGDDVISLVNENDESCISINTNYALYKIYISDSDNALNVSDNGKNKEIYFNKDDISLNKDFIKYSLRRYFIADEQLFNFYLKRGDVVRPHEAQEKALNSLIKTRNDGFKKALVVLATGVGKTVLSALDVKETRAKKVLFIVHINEILKQTKESFERVLPGRKGEMGFYTGKQKDNDKNILFASIQTMSREKNLQNFSTDHFDYIIIDETHHTAAPTYLKIFEYFRPNFILGLTATPDRMDNKDILNFYDNNVVFEIGQKDAIEQGYLVPFRYLGFKDNVDYSNIYFNGFRYDIKDLNKHLLIDARDSEIIKKYKEYAGTRKTIGFCASIEHAERCARIFRESGVSSIAVHSKSEGVEDNGTKEDLIKYFRDNRYQVAFVVDMFNEGVDIPDVSCLLFLRPTESKTIFIQHMGRGLRISPGKENVLIMDFIGNYRTANVILDGLSIKNGIRGLKKVNVNDKDLFVYDNNNCQISFDSEVIDIFKDNELKYSKEVKDEFIDKEWVEYSDYLKDWTKNNLYWKRGQQNQYFEVNFEALKIIRDNPSISQDDFVKKIQIIVDKKYPNKNMTAGFRSLIISKIAGFVSPNYPFKIEPPFEEICKSTDDFSNYESYKDILTIQLEKIFYWNSIYGSYNKYVDSKERVSFKDFKIYPFFFLYEVLIKLMDEYGSEPIITKFEFDSFVSITKEHSEIRDVVERILRYRENEEKNQITKLLNSKNLIDSRFYSITRYNKYFEQNNKFIKLRDVYIDEIRLKIKEFNDLYINDNLIVFDENSPEKYYNMLYSIKDLISFSKNKE